MSDRARHSHEGFPMHVTKEGKGVWDKDCPECAENLAGAAPSLDTAHFPVCSKCGLPAPSCKCNPNPAAENGADAARIGEIAARAENLPPGTWTAEWDDNGQWYVEPLGLTGTRLRGDSGDCVEAAIAQFIANAKQDIPYLLAELERLRTWKESAMNIMAPMQDIGREIGVKLGQPIHDKILPWILKAKEEAERLRGESDAAKERVDSFLRDSRRPLDAIAREIVETLRPTDKPGSSEYNVVWVGSKLKSITEGLHAKIRDLEAAQPMPAKGETNHE